MGSWSVDMSCGTDFTKQKDHDLILVIENKNLYVHKLILSLSSPVFKAMVAEDGNFTESQAKVIHLPGKRLKPMVDFLRCIYPYTNPDTRVGVISSKNVFSVYALADEYQVEKLQQQCVGFLCNKIITGHHLCSPDWFEKILLFCTQYNVPRCKEKCEKETIDVIRGMHTASQLLPYLEKAYQNGLHELYACVKQQLEQKGRCTLFPFVKNMNWKKGDVYKTLQLGESFGDEDLRKLGVKRAIKMFSTADMVALYDRKDLGGNTFKKIMVGKLDQQK